MGYVVLIDRSYVVGRHGGNRHCVPTKRAELDLVGTSLVVYVNHRPDVPRIQLIVGEIVSKNNAIMFVDHPSQERRSGRQ